MAKALIVSVYHVAKSGSDYEFTANALVEDGQGDATAMTVSLTSPTFAPGPSVLRSAWRGAVIAKAASDLSIVVDEVLFPDFEA